MMYQKNFPLFLSVVSAVFYGVTSQTLSLFACKNFQGIDYQDYDALKGTWYEYEKTPFADEKGARCVTFIMDTPIKGKQPTQRLQIKNSLFSEHQDDRKVNSTITGAGKGVTPSNFQYTYLYADYEKLLVVYACKDIFYVAKNDVIWVLTRERFPPSEVILKAESVIREYGLSTDNLKKTNQTSCPDKWNESK